MPCRLCPARYCLPGRDTSSHHRLATSRLACLAGSCQASAHRAAPRSDLPPLDSLASPARTSQDWLRQVGRASPSPDALRRRAPGHTKPLQARGRLSRLAAPSRANPCRVAPSGALPSLARIRRASPARPGLARPRGPCLAQPHQAPPRAACQAAPRLDSSGPVMPSLERFRPAMPCLPRQFAPSRVAPSGSNRAAPGHACRVWIVQPCPSGRAPPSPVTPVWPRRALSGGARPAQWRRATPAQPRRAWTSRALSGRSGVALPRPACRAVPCRAFLALPRRAEGALPGHACRVMPGLVALRQTQPCLVSPVV